MWVARGWLLVRSGRGRARRCTLCTVHIPLRDVVGWFPNQRETEYLRIPVSALSFCNCRHSWREYLLRHAGRGIDWVDYAPTHENWTGLPRFFAHTVGLPALDAALFFIRCSQ